MSSTPAVLNLSAIFSCFPDFSRHELRVFLVFGPNIRVDDTGSSPSYQWSPSIAVNTDGNIYVAWADKRNGNLDIYFAKSTDDGAYFGTNVRVDDSGLSTKDQSNPSIVLQP